MASKKGPVCVRLEEGVVVGVEQGGKPIDYEVLSIRNDVEWDEDNDCPMEINDGDEDETEEE